MVDHTDLAKVKRHLYNIAFSSSEIMVKSHIAIKNKVQ